jgi:hypothetical protein
MGILARVAEGWDLIAFAITRYYKLARTCHPDKNPDDPTAEEKVCAEDQKRAFSF